MSAQEFKYQLDPTQPVRVGICSLIAFAVLSFGAVQFWAQAILDMGCAGLLFLWGILAMRRRKAEIHWNWLYMPLLGLGALGFVQYAFGTSAYPYATKMELLRWSACLVLFFLATESFRTTGQTNGLAWFLVILSFLVSLLAVVQQFQFHGKLYGVLAVDPDAQPFGPFVNRDDFAGFIELTAPIACALILFRAERREKLPLLVLMAVLPVGALVLCASRGGIAGFVFGFLVLLLLARVGHAWKPRLVAAAALLLIAGSFVAWLGMREAVQRFEGLSVERISEDPRLSMYRDTWQIFLHHPRFGAGLGTFPVVYPQFESRDPGGLIVEHAHNDYLELLADTGVAGGICGLAFVTLLFRQGLANLHMAGGRLRCAVYAGSLSACAALLLHSLVDFNLHIPSNALIFILLAAVATSEAPEAVPSGQPSAKAITGIGATPRSLQVAVQRRISPSSRERGAKSLTTILNAEPGGPRLNTRVSPPLHPPESSVGEPLQVPPPVRY